MMTAVPVATAHFAVALKIDLPRLVLLCAAEPPRRGALNPGG
jgi:hypothetical protein